MPLIRSLMVRIASSDPTAVRYWLRTCTSANGKIPPEVLESWMENQLSSSTKAKRPRPRGNTMN